MYPNGRAGAFAPINPQFLVQAGFRVLLEEVPATALREIEFADKVPPVAGKFLAFADDVFQIVIGHAVAGDVRARKSQAL